MSKTGLCLQMLRVAGSTGITTGQFLQAGVGSRYGARIKELRDQGYEIESKRIRDGSWRYVLVPQPERLPNNPASSQPLSGSGTSTALFDLPKPSRSAITGEVL